MREKTAIPGAVRAGAGLAVAVALVCGLAFVVTSAREPSTSGVTGTPPAELPVAASSPDDVEEEIPERVPADGEVVTRGAALHGAREAGSAGDVLALARTAEAAPPSEALPAALPAGTAGALVALPADSRGSLRDGHGAGSPGAMAAPPAPPPSVVTPPTASPAVATTPLAAPPTAAVMPSRGVLASTFVGGGGTAAHLADLMDRGVMVDGESIRLGALEELGRLPYPVPGHEAVGLHAELERSRLLEGGERVHLQIALLAREGERPVRPHMDIRLVLDRSGSMAGPSWEHAVAAAHALVDRLDDDDTLGLISYSDDASIDLAPARVGSGRAAHAAIDRLAPGGGTNIDAALSLAAVSPPRHTDPTDVALVVLVSDGQATIGRTTAGELAPIARQMFDATGALTTTIGLGTSFDEDVMLSIAREGSGSYHFVRNAEDVGEILEDELDERALAVAQDLRLRVVLAPGVTVHRVYGSRVLSETEEAAVRHTELAVDARIAHELGVARDRTEDTEEGLRMHIPTFRRGDQHVVLFELDVPAGMGTSEVAEVFLDYKDLREAENVTAHETVTAERTADVALAETSVRRPVKRTVLAFQAADALQGAAAALGVGDVMRAHAILDERVTLLRAAADLWDDEALGRDALLLSRYERVIDRAYGSFGTSDRRTLAMAMAYYGDERMN